MRVTKFQEIQECRECKWHQTWDRDNPAVTKGGEWVCPDCGELGSLDYRIGRYHLETIEHHKTVRMEHKETEWKR